MWAVFLLLLSYSDGDLAKGELSALDGGKEISSFPLSASSCADTSACLVGLSTSTQTADNAKPKRATQETGDRKYPASGEHTLRRSKRGFTYPGTLWCGAGNIADNYEQLGEFAETDRCCRTHDFCPHVIHAFSSKYGFTNFKWHSISHCDCDNAMKECLRDVNDTSSRVVGQAFFNVIEVPCFEFSFEEQCVERHWYGVCKRYDKVPVAVIRESVPYDFGGIEVIDVLTIAPPKKKIAEKDEGKQEEIQKSEGTFASGSKNLAAEEPSLTNVVTAAEDFIKVLATVSTSQSSSTDGGSTGETQASDKKRKKNAGKKKKDSKKRRGNGKGKKRKQNKDTVPKNNGSVTGAPSAHRAEDVISKNSFAEDSGNLDWVSKNDNFMKNPFTSVGDTEHTNKMMRDEHQRTPDESQVSTTTAPDAKHAVKMLAPQMQIKDIELVQLFSSVPLAITSKPTTAIPRQRAAKKKQRHPTPPTFLAIKGTSHNMMADNTAVSTTKSTSLAGLTTHTPIRLSGEVAPHSLESQHEKGSAFNAAAQNTSIVGTKRLRSRQKWGRRKSRKLYRSSSPSDSLTIKEPAVLLTDTIQELTVGPIPKPCSASERLQTNSPKSIPEKPTKGVSGESKTIKCTEAKKRTRRPKSESSITEHTIKARQKASAVLVTGSSTGSAITDPATQAKHAVESTRQPFSSRLQTITPSMLLLKARTTKRRKQRRGMTRVEEETKAQKALFNYLKQNQ